MGNRFPCWRTTETEFRESTEKLVKFTQRNLETNTHDMDKAKQALQDACQLGNRSEMRMYFQRIQELKSERESLLAPRQLAEAARTVESRVTRNKEIEKEIKTVAKYMDSQPINAKTVRKVMDSIEKHAETVMTLKEDTDPSQLSIDDPTAATFNVNDEPEKDDMDLEIDKYMQQHFPTDPPPRSAAVAEPVSTPQTTMTSVNDAVAQQREPPPPPMTFKKQRELAPPPTKQSKQKAVVRNHVTSDIPVLA